MHSSQWKCVFCNELNSIGEHRCSFCGCKRNRDFEIDKSTPKKKNKKRFSFGIFLIVVLLLAAFALLIWYIADETKFSETPRNTSTTPQMANVTDKASVIYEVTPTPKPIENAQVKSPEVFSENTSERQIYFPQETPKVQVDNRTGGISTDENDFADSTLKERF